MRQDDQTRRDGGGKNALADPIRQQHARAVADDSSEDADGGRLGQEKAHHAPHRSAERLHQSDVAPPLESQPRHRRQDAERRQRQDQRDRREQQPANALEQSALGRRKLPHRLNIKLRAARRQGGGSHFRS